MADQPSFRPDSWLKRSEIHCAWWSTAVVFVITIAWTLFQETHAKYLIYTLPFIIPALYFIGQQGVLRVYGSGLIALMMYVGLALASLLYNGPVGYYSYRDLLIIGGYLCLFAVYVRMPPFVADLVMVTLALALAIEAVNHGIGLNIDFVASEGIIESVLAFPLGVVLLYYVHECKWARALIALVLLFLAFKRMALFAAFSVVLMDLAFRFIGSKGINRYLAAGFVVICSVTALYLFEVFEFVADTFAPEGVNANKLSLGRWDWATVLWDHIDSHGYSYKLIGFGPGASDQLIGLHEGVETNPHNDWLKLLFDYGALGFIGGHVILYVTLARNSLGVMVYVYTAILMMTTNPIVYMFYFVFAFLVIRIALKSRRTRSLFSFGPRGGVQTESAHA